MNPGNDLQRPYFPNTNGSLDRYRRELWKHISDCLRIMNVSPEQCVEATGLLPIGVDVFFAKASVFETTLDEMVEFADLMGIRVKLSAKL